MTVLQSACDLSSGVSVMPLTSRMFILPNPMGPHKVSLFFKQLTAAEAASAFVPLVSVDLDKVGVVATISRANPKRTVEVVVEAEDTTRTLVIRDALSTEDMAWEQKKTLGFMRVRGGIVSHRVCVSRHRQGGKRLYRGVRGL